MQSDAILRERGACQARYDLDSRLRGNDDRGGMTMGVCGDFAIVLAAGVLDGLKATGSRLAEADAGGFPVEATRD